VPGRRPPLAGIRVLDLTRFVAGPYCTMLLADQGAEVVKVEPFRGEDTRALDVKIDGVSAYFLRFNRSKKSICVDLKHEAGRGVFERLVRVADVLVENFRPGVLERLGLGWPRLRELNPRLIYATITGFGHSPSPYRDRAAFTPIVEGVAGAVIYRNDHEPPTITGYPVGDIFPAALAAGAIGMGLFRRTQDGEGARIDMAMYDAMVSMNERAVGMAGMVGRDFLPGRAADLGSAPSGVFRASDGFLSISVVGDRIWERFCAAIDRLDWTRDERLATGPGRAEHFHAVIKPGMEAWLGQRTRAEAVELLSAAGVPAAEVARPLEILDAPQARARDMIVEYEAEGGVRAKVVGNPIRFDGEPRLDPGAAPALGQHTVDVLREWAGLGDGEIDELLAAPAIHQQGRP
jgi:CoA:oxalate CoA-transferase